MSKKPPYVKVEFSTLLVGQQFEDSKRRRWEKTSASWAQLKNTEFWGEQRAFPGTTKVKVIC